eukprot:EG_transcript_56311
MQQKRTRSPAEERREGPQSRCPGTGRPGEVSVGQGRGAVGKRSVGAGPPGMDAISFECQQGEGSAAAGPRLLRVSRRQDRAGATKEKKAERAARLERTIAA